MRYFEQFAEHNGTQLQQIEPDMPTSMPTLPTRQSQRANFRSIPASVFTSPDALGSFYRSGSPQRRLSPIS